MIEIRNPATQLPKESQKKKKKVVQNALKHALNMKLPKKKFFFQVKKFQNFQKKFQVLF